MVVAVASIVPAVVVRGGAASSGDRNGTVGLSVACIVGGSLREGQLVRFLNGDGQRCGTLVLVGDLDGVLAACKVALVAVA